MSDSGITCLYGHEVAIFGKCEVCGTMISCNSGSRVAARRDLLNAISIRGFDSVSSRTIKLSMHPDDISEAVDRMPHHVRRAFVEHTIDAFMRGAHHRRLHARGEVSGKGGLTPSPNSGVGLPEQCAMMILR